jgi:hypothetical protein
MKAKRNSIIEIFRIALLNNKKAAFPFHLISFPSLERFIEIPVEGKKNILIQMK